MSDNETQGSLGNDPFNGVRMSAIADLKASLEGPAGDKAPAQTPEVEPSKTVTETGEAIEPAEGENPDAEGLTEDESDEDGTGEDEAAEDDAEESKKKNRERLGKRALQKIEQREQERDAAKAEAEEIRTNFQEALTIAQELDGELRQVSQRAEVAESQLQLAESHIQRLHQRLAELGQPVSDTEIQNLQAQAQAEALRRERDAYQQQLQSYQQQQEQQQQYQTQQQQMAQARALKAELEQHAKKYRVPVEDAVIAYITATKAGLKRSPLEAVRRLASPQVRAQLESQRAEPKPIKSGGSAPAPAYPPGREGAIQRLVDEGRRRN